MRTATAIWLLVTVAASVEAANNSTSAGGGGEPQFLTEPNDVHKRVGQSVVMPCRVKNRNQGRVQWTRDGFGLGSSRTTDFPRYSVIGNDLDSKPNSLIFHAFCNCPQFTSVITATFKNNVKFSITIRNDPLFGLFLVDSKLISFGHPR